MSKLIIYDKAKWHYIHPSFPADLPEQKGYLYGGFFLAWSCNEELLSDDFLDDWGEEVQLTLRREHIPTWLYQVIDGSLTSETFSDKGNDFARYCFESDDFDYYALFEHHLASGLPTPYHVEDTWENYDVLASELTKVYKR